MLECQICRRLISRYDADGAAEIVGPGHETMCPTCAVSVASLELAQREMDAWAKADQNTPAVPNGPTPSVSE